MVGSHEHPTDRPEKEEEIEIVASHVAASVPSFVKNWEFPTESSSALSRRTSCERTFPRGDLGSSRHRESEDLEADETSSDSAVISSEMSTEKNDGVSGKHELESIANKSLASLEGKIIEKVEHSIDGKDVQNNCTAAKEQNNVTEIQSHDSSDASSDDDSFIY